MLHTSILGVLAVVSTVLAIDCSAKELEPYNFELLKGIHSVTSLKETPPSQTNITWYFGICETINENVDQCPKNSDLCGITTVNFDADPKKSVVSEIVGFNSNLQKSYKPIEDGEGIIVSYKGANWGSNLVDAQIKFICSKNDDDKLDEFVLDKWDGSVLEASVLTKGACITNDKDKKKPDKDDKKHTDNGESWGWFTWIFIFMVLFLSIYIIGGAWFQYNKGNSIDFQTALKEVLDNFVDLLKGLPAFVREIVEKVTGNSNRGEYSAV